MVKYEWIAHYNDGSDFSQFDENGNERLFGEIDKDKLISFELVNKDNNDQILVKNFGVLLNSGQFFINSAVLNIEPTINHYKHKLIFFKRNRKTVSARGSLPTRTLYILGFETKLQDGKVIKQMYAIDERGVGIVRFEN